MSKLTESFFENTLTPTSFCHHPLRYAFKLREPQTPVNSAYNRLIANFHGFLTGCVTCFALVDNSSLELIPYRSGESTGKGIAPSLLRRMPVRLCRRESRSRANVVRLWLAYND